MKARGDIDKTIHLKLDTRRKLNAFRSALGMTQDACVQWLIDQQKHDGETAWQAGERLFKEWETKQEKERIEWESTLLP